MNVVGFSRSFVIDEFQGAMIANQTVILSAVSMQGLTPPPDIKGSCTSALPLRNALERCLRWPNKKNGRIPCLAGRRAAPSKYNI